MRFVVIGPVSPVRGGIAHHTTELCKHLQKEHSVTVFSLERLYRSFIHRLLYKGNSLFDNDTQKQNYEKRTTLSINPVSWILSAMQIRRLKPDHVIITWADPYSYPFVWVLSNFLPKETKVILICHEILSQEKRILGTLLAKLAFKRADKLIVHSDQDYLLVERMIPTADAQKLFHPIYSSFYRNISPVMAKRFLGLKGNVLLFFGYIRKYKGLKYLIHALPEIITKIPITLLIVGEFWENKQYYLRLIKQLHLENNVKIIDHYVDNEEVAAYFSAADAVVTPYIAGTQSGIINIAYAFNKPVITTNVGGLGEIVKNGKTGYVVEPKNSNKLALAIIRFYTENKRQKFKNNIQKIKKDHSWEMFCKKLLESIK